MNKIRTLRRTLAMPFVGLAILLVLAVLGLYFLVKLIAGE